MPKLDWLGGASQLFRITGKTSRAFFFFFPWLHARHQTQTEQRNREPRSTQKKKKNGGFASKGCGTPHLDRTVCLFTARSPGPAQRCEGRLAGRTPAETKKRCGSPVTALFTRNTLHVSLENTSEGTAFYLALNNAKAKFPPTYRSENIVDQEYSIYKVYTIYEV